MHEPVNFITHPSNVCHLLPAADANASAKSFNQRGLKSFRISISLKSKLFGEFDFRSALEEPLFKRVLQRSWRTIKFLKIILIIEKGSDFVLVKTASNRTTAFWLTILLELTVSGVKIRLWPALGGAKGSRRTCLVERTQLRNGFP